MGVAFAPVDGRTSNVLLDSVQAEIMRKGTYLYERLMVGTLWMGSLEARPRLDSLDSGRNSPSEG
jgi:hypothetical protein